MHSCNIKRVSSSVIQTMRGVGLLALCVGLSLATPGIEDFLHKHGFSNLTKNFLDEEVRMEVLSSQLTGWRLGNFLASFFTYFFLFFRSDEATLTRQHCPHCDKFLLAKSMVCHTVWQIRDNFTFHH